MKAPRLKISTRLTLLVSLLILTQAIVADLRLATDASLISIGDMDGIRLVHPKPERIGKPMVGGDNYRALELGESYISKAVGSLGESIQGKTPVFNDQGKTISNQLVEC